MTFSKIQKLRFWKFVFETILSNYLISRYSGFITTCYVTMSLFKFVLFVILDIKQKFEKRLLLLLLTIIIDILNKHVRLSKSNCLNMNFQSIHNVNSYF